jgi:hypothetical protein
MDLGAQFHRCISDIIHFPRSEWSYHDWSRIISLFISYNTCRIDDHKVPTTHFGISASPRMSIDVQRGTGVYALMVSKFLDFLDALKVQFLFAQLESSAINLTVDMS